MVHGLLATTIGELSCAELARCLGIIMILHLFAVSLAICFGFAGASFLRWIYVLLTGEMLGYRHLREPGRYQPLRALAVMASGPDIMLGWGLRKWRTRKLAAMLILALSLGWSFFLGVVILTKVFGIT